MWMMLIWPLCPEELPPMANLSLMQWGGRWHNLGTPRISKGEAEALILTSDGFLMVEVVAILAEAFSIKVYPDLPHTWLTF
jgi:hypothetical protein